MVRFQLVPSLLHANESPPLHQVVVMVLKKLFCRKVGTQTCARQHGSSKENVKKSGGEETRDQ